MGIRRGGDELGAALLTVLEIAKEYASDEQHGLFFQGRTMPAKRALLEFYDDDDPSWAIAARHNDKEGAVQLAMNACHLNEDQATTLVDVYIELRAR